MCHRPVCIANVIHSVRHSALYIYTHIVSERENMTDRVAFHVEGVTNVDYVDRRRRIHGEEALVRLTNHRGNPVIFPSSTYPTGVFLLLLFFSFYFQMRVVQPLNRQTLGTSRQIIGPLSLTPLCVQLVWKSESHRT